MPADTTALWTTFSDGLLGFIRARVSDDATAEDLRQDVFVRIVERIGQLEDDDKIAGWVYRIARNRIVDHYRDRKPSVALPASLQQPVADDNQLDQLLGAWLVGQVEMLPEPYRNAMQRVELEGRSQVELADELGLSISGAKSRVQRGRAKLRAELEACCRVERDRRGNVIEVEPKPQCC